MHIALKKSTVFLPARHSVTLVLRYMFLIALTSVLGACGNSGTQVYQPEFSAMPVATGPEYVFGIHPQRNPEKLRAVFGPLIGYLNKHVQGATFVFEASRSYAAFDQKLYGRQFAFVLPNPYETVKATEKGYRVFAKMGDDDDLRGLILVRRDSGISNVFHLKGKAVSFPAPTALAATLMPKLFLQTHGLNVNSDIQPLYVGSMESSIMTVYMRNAAAGTAYPPAWRMFKKEQPKIAAELKVLWETDSLPNNSVMARDDVPRDLVDRVAQALFTMQTNPEGRAVLARMDLSAFEPASNETYDPVRVFLQKYQAALGPLNQ